MTLSGRLLVTVYLIGVYTNFCIYSGRQLLIPAVICAFAGSWLLLKNLSRITQDHVKLIGSLICVALLSIVFSPGLTRFLVELVKSYLQLTLSLIWAYSLYLELTTWSRSQLRGYFLKACILILVGCALEVATPFSRLSDAFREFAYQGAFIYDASDRDLELFGGIRPKLFTQEPSHVARFFLVSSTFYLVLSSSPYRYLTYFVLNASLFALSRSTTQAAFIPMGLSVALLLNRRDSTSSFRMLFKIALLFVMVLFLSTIAAVFARDRLELMMQGKDGSAFARFIGPFLVVLLTLQKYPIFGTGIGGHEVIEKIIIDVFMGFASSVGARRTALINDNVASIIANAFCNFFIYFGIVGAILFLIPLAKMGRRMGGGYTLFFLSNWLIQMNLDGNFCGTRIWSYCFMTLVMGHVYAANLPPLKSPNPIGGSSIREFSPISPARGSRGGTLIDRGP